MAAAMAVRWLVPSGLFDMMRPTDFGSPTARKNDCMYRAVTRQIEVTVEPNFLPERSSVENRQYFWSYTIVITNTGEETVQLQTCLLYTSPSPRD